MPHNLTFCECSFASIFVSTTIVVDSILSLFQWGVLFSLQNDLRNVELTKAMWADTPAGFIRVGRATDSEVVIGDDQLPKKSLHQLSRLQFVIRKNSDGALAIYDRSSNGTFIDEKKIGKGM